MNGVSKGDNSSMTSTYRFMRTHNGVTAYAKISMTSHVSDSWKLSWNGPILDIEGIYGHAVQMGFQLAAVEHEKRGGMPQHVTLTALVESATDTKPDAVRCATTLAAWEAWGHSSAETKVVFDQHEWVVIFQAS